MLQPRTLALLPRIGTAFGTALALLALSGEPASAAGSSLYGEGLHVSAGALVDPDGRTWVADHNGGFCRMTRPSDTRHAQIEHPAHPGDPGARTCLGGLLPDAGTGPDAAGQPVFVDPTPQWVEQRRRGRPHPGRRVPELGRRARPAGTRTPSLFEFQDIITMIGARVRPTSLSLGPDDAVYVGFQRGNDVQRIVDPAGDLPQVEVVANLGRRQRPDRGRRPRRGRRDRRLHRGGDRPPRHPPGHRRARERAGPFDGLDPNTAIGAMYYDLDDDKLYIGTAAGLTEADAGIDTIIQVDTRENTATEFASNFSMVGGIAKTAGRQPVRPRRPGAPRARRAARDRPDVPRRPARRTWCGAARRRGRGRPRAPHGRPHAHLHVRATGDPVPHPRQGQRHGLGEVRRGPRQYTFERELQDGEYTLSVRATRTASPACRRRFRFTVDTTRRSPRGRSPRRGRYRQPQAVVRVPLGGGTPRSSAPSTGRARGLRPGPHPHVRGHAKTRARAAHRRDRPRRQPQRARRGAATRSTPPAPELAPGSAEGRRRTRARRSSRAACTSPRARSSTRTAAPGSRTTTAASAA